MQPAGTNDWVPAEINRPFTLGDYLYTDDGARAELHLDNAVLRMGSQTSFGFLNLNDQVVQIKLSEGDMSFRLHDLGTNQVFEVDTPNAAVMLLRNGLYRFRVDPNGAMSFVVVREGQAEVTGGGQAFTLNPGNSAIVNGADQLSYDVEVAPAPDDFDLWCSERDAHEAHLASAQYLPPTVVGYEDLDDNGVWQEAPDYGPVWYPRQVAADWAPYREGHWAWIDPWGWTWVDSARWGFAPFHYGRWASINGRWGWCPGPIVVVGHHNPPVRPYYAPALVAWFGGAHWSVSISSGGPSLGWVPLGFGEVYTPRYHCSPRYFSNVNVSNTRIVKTVNITNVYNTVYVNKTVYNQQYVNVRAPGGVTAMPQSAFASGRSVRQGGFAVKQADAATIQPGAALIALPVASNRGALPSGVRGNVTRPAAAVFNRKVVAQNAPPSTPAALVRQAPPVTRPIEVRPGQRFGNPQAFRTAAQPQQQVQPRQERQQVQAQPVQTPDVVQRHTAPQAPIQQVQPVNQRPDRVDGEARRQEEHPAIRPAQKTAPQPQTAPEHANQQHVQQEHNAPQPHEENHPAQQHEENHPVQPHGENHPAQAQPHEENHPAQPHGENHPAQAQPHDDHHPSQPHEDHKDGDHKQQHQ